jgi:hypothetical protein
MASDALIGSAGLKLMDVAPVVFPEHVLVKHLKSELNLARKAMMMRGWKDNGPQRLLAEIAAFNRIHHECRCLICSEHINVPVYRRNQQDCRLWDKITWFMGQAGLQYCYLARESEDEEYVEYTPEAARHGSSKAVIEWPFSVVKPESKETGFDPLTACKYLAPVSDMKVHFVFRRAKHLYDLVYGRKLWQHDSFENTEMQKLDLFRARLRSL